jgi:PAS domain S-box-containing protein
VPGEQLRPARPKAPYGLARDLQQPVYSQPAGRPDNSGLLQLHVPLADQGKFAGVILGEYSIDGLLRYGVPTEVTAKYAVTLLDGKGRVLAGNLAAAAQSRPRSCCPGPRSRRIRGAGLAGGQRPGDARAGLPHLAGRDRQRPVLAGQRPERHDGWMLIGNWRHTRRRMQAQQALMAETNFRRAMENSMLTGMRALDMHGRITYVNPAFCQMTGWSEAELVGRTPPFPYWPEEDRELLCGAAGRRTATAAPAGRLPGARQAQERQPVRRPHVRVAADRPQGHQTGWMTSMTDITEPNRIREQLQASHERFTTVLEALDAAVSVAPLGSEELLFANKLYRLWFGGRPSAT